MPAIRHDDLLLRLVKEVNDIKAALRRMVANLPLFDIANENTPPQLTASQNDYAPGNYDVLLLQGSKVVSITGIRGGVKGRSLRLFNIGDYSILIPHESTSSQTANRFRLQGGNTPVYLASIEPNTTLEFYYLNSEQRWVTLAEPPTYDLGNYWDSQTAPVFTKSVCYSPELNLFVAVGTNVCMISSDGISWTEVDIYSGEWKDVIWNNVLNIFIAVNSDILGSKFLYSTDGLNWNKINLSYDWSTFTWTTGGGFVSYDVIWAPEKKLFVEVGANGSYPYISYSSDGSAWTGHQPGIKNALTGVAWSAELNLFVAVGSTAAGGEFFTSTDGITWNPRSVSYGLKKVVWSPELLIFVGVGSNTYESLYSSDGITWNHGSFGGLLDICWSPELGIFVAVGSNQVKTSTDGIVFTSRTAAEANIWSSVTWSPELGLFVAVSSDGTNRVQTSPDGITWTARSIANYPWQRVCWAAEIGKFCVVSNSSVYSALSDSTIIPNTIGNSVASNGTISVSVGNSKCFTTTDGTTWTERTIPAGTYNAVCWSDDLNLFVAVGSSNLCATSPDGITWTSRTISNGTWNGVAYSPELGLFVAVSSATNYVATSPNGITWTARTATAGTWMSVTWSSELHIFIAVGTDISMISYNGIVWTDSSVTPSGSWSGIVWSPELTTAIAVASAGANKVMKAP